MTAPAAYAESFSSVLDDLILRYGVYENGKGIIYADMVHFSQTPSFMVIYANDGAIFCEVYDNNEGIQCTDQIKLSSSYNAEICIKSNQIADFLSVKTDNGLYVYTIKDDCFRLTTNNNFNTKTKVVSVNNKKITPHTSKRSLYSFKNSLTEKKINEYLILNCINTIPQNERQDMLAFIRACADIMSFDINDYDYDTFMKYLLSGNQNFKILTDINCTLTQNEDGINIINAQYIDYILKNYFNIVPQNRAMNSLITNGFCVDNGYYYYKNAFNTFYATNVIDLKAIYKLSENTYYIVFKDIYQQGNISFPEYSYAIITQTQNGIYNLLKLGMGKELLSEKELAQYITNPHEHVWSAKNKPQNTTMLNFVLLSLISFGFVAICCGIVLIFLYIRNK